MKTTKRLGIVLGIMVCLVIGCSTLLEPEVPVPEPEWEEKIILTEDFTGINPTELPEGWSKEENGGTVRVENNNGEYCVVMTSGYHDNSSTLSTMDLIELVPSLNKDDKIRGECKFKLKKGDKGSAFVKVANDLVRLTKADSWTEFSLTADVGPIPKEYPTKVEFGASGRFSNKTTVFCVDKVVITHIYKN